MKKLNFKAYQGKDRIYGAVAGASGIYRVYVWDEAKQEYRPPERGKGFFATRYERDEANRKKRRFCYCETLGDARAWQGRLDPEPESDGEELFAKPGSQGPRFADVVAEWRQRKYPTYARGTRFQYDKLMRLAFGSLMDLPVRTITPRVVDEWLAKLKAGLGITWQSKTRKSFEKELVCLGVILRYYESYNDDAEFRFPIKKRHREDAQLRRVAKKPSKDLPPADFQRFLTELATGKHGATMVVLATVQYHQALRISEAAALHWEDVQLVWTSPNESRVRIVRHVEWGRSAGIAAEITPGFKNSGPLGGEKEQPLFPETFGALRSRYYIGAKGLVFHDGTGTVFSYQAIQRAYNRAFKRAGLPYSATHVMRHGGCRRVFNETKDIGVAAQILGNISLATVEVYAKRYKTALTELSQTHWEKPDCSHLFANAKPPS